MRPFSPPTSLNATDLVGSGLCAQLLRALFEQRCITKLLPLQRQVLEQTEFVRGEESLLVSAPTASGKTLVAEIGIAKALERSQKCFYLVPTRPLAEEKARSLRAWLEPFGVRVACSTSERRGDDSAIQSCQVDIIVSVYEKAFCLTAPPSGLWANLGLIVADEIQLLGDRERGGAIDLWLARWRRTPAPRPRLVALSAVLGQPERLADWLGVRLVQSNARRLPLREGTLDLATGIYRWRDRQSQIEGEEPLIQGLGRADDDPDADRAVAAIVGLAHRAGPVLVFCATRREAVGLAARLADQELPPHAAADMEALGDLPRDQSREWLEELLPRGVGLHTADLPPVHRSVVERAFEAGRLPVLVATPTLEQGVNLAAATVVSTGRTLERDALTGRGVLVPLGRARFANQGGRAGRGETGVGRSIVFAETEFEAAQAWRNLITPEAARVESALGADCLLGAVATLLAEGRARTRAQVGDLMAASFAAAGAGGERLRRQLDSDLTEGVRTHLWTSDEGGRLHATALGEVLARTWISPATLCLWRELLADVDRAAVQPALVFVVALAEEWHGLPLLVEPGDRRANRWPVGLLERLATDDALARRAAALLTGAGGVPVAHHRAARIALALDDWLAGQSLPELEQVHGLSTGLLHRVASTGAWLARSAAETAAALRRPPVVVEAFEELARAIARLLDDRVFAAVEERPIPPEVAGTADSTVVVAVKEPAPETRESIDAAPEESTMTVPIVAAQLVFPANDPGCVVFCGRRVALTPTEYRLLETMARAAGRTLTYAEIDAAVWPDAKVCRDQVRQHRNSLEAKLGPAAEALFRTRRRWGIEVLIDPAAIAWSNEAKRAAG